MLGVASILDLQSRRVSNRVWIPFVAAAMPFQVIALFDYGVIPFVIAVGATAAAYGLWYTGMLFGGADAKALMVLAWLLPAYQSPSADQLVPVLDLFMNGLFATMAYPLALAAINLVGGRLHPAMFIGTPRPLDEIAARHVFPLQRVRPDGTVYFRAWPRRNENFAQVVQDLRSAGVTEAWATPKIPFMVPLLVGLLLAWKFGNLVLLVLRLSMPAS